MFAEAQERTIGKQSEKMSFPHEERSGTGSSPDW